VADREGIGINGVMDHLKAAFAQQPWAAGMVGDNLGFSPVVRSTEIAPGVVYKDANVTVTAFEVAHKTAIAFGYRVQTADRVIVISGDTRPVQAVIDACNGCDLLFHEVFGLRFGPEGPTGSAQGHTSAEELGELARRARPKHLVIYHDVGISSKDAGLNAIRKAFSGNVTFAEDLDTF
jgi:ribonuclease Z